MGNLGWVAAGLGSIALGLALWYTAFVLVPLGVVLIAVGGVKILKKVRT